MKHPTDPTDLDAIHEYAVACCKAIGQNNIDAYLVMRKIIEANLAGNA